MNSVLVVKEKWGDSYFDVRSKDDLNKFALQILTERYEQGYWYDPTEEEWELIEKAVEEKDGDLAWRILKARSEKGYEYERVSVETYR